MTKTLLAVEDSKTMRRVLDITFASAEYEAVIAGSAQQALSQLEAVRPDLVLLDVTLGDKDGYELCREVKTRAPGVPVMILSSRQQPYDAARGAAVQADDFIDKPFDTQQIRDKVDKLCAAAAARPAPRAVPAPPSPPAHINPPVALPRTPVPPAPARRPPPAPRAAPAAAVAVAAPAPVAAVSASPMAGAAAGLEERLAELNLTAEQVEGVLALSREVVEQVVWEVVPVLAETLIKEEIARLTQE